MRTRPISSPAAIESLERRTLLDGLLDPGWGTAGIVYLKPAKDVPNVAPRSDGSVIAHANRYSHDDFLYRLLGDGSVDLEYGNINGGESPGGFDVATQSDNRLLYATGYDVARYSSTGVREDEFRGPMLNTGPDAAVIEAFTRLPNDSFAIAGRNDPHNPTWSGIEWFNADGSHRVSIEQSNTIVSLVGQADGKLLALISTSNGQVLERFTSNGQLDSSFANDTVIPAPSDPDPEIRGVTHYVSISIEGSGRIYAGGFMPANQADYQGAVVVRYLTDGTLDSSYGTDGLARGWPSALVSRGVAFRVAPDGRMYVAATTWPREEDIHIAAWRLNADGSGDRTWGTDGITEVDVTIGTDAIASVSDLEFMSDGDVIVSGAGTRINGTNPRYAIGVALRFNVDPAPASIANINGVLTITGRPIADTIYVKTARTGRISATANDVTQTFAASSIKSVLINAGDGNDYIDLTGLAPLAGATADFPVTVNGDAGKDLILGSLGPDRLVGGNDNDRIAGYAGDDWISGSAQSDRITGGAGDDSLLGNGGRDYLSGEDGDDTLLGGDQPDVLSGDAGNDNLLGEGGHDHLTGGDGTDIFSGGGGNDTFFARDTIAESILGGAAGFDTAYVDVDDILVSIEAPKFS